MVLIAGFLAVTAVCAGLGVWQLDRLGGKRAANAIALTARSEPIVMLEGTREDSALANRRLRARGHYDHAHDIVVRGRVYRGVPGVEIVSPLVLEGEKTAVLVNRGFVPSADAVTVNAGSVREPGLVQVDGIALPIDSGSGTPLRRGNLTTWSRLDRAALRSSLPYPIHAVYIRQFPDSTLPRFPRRLDPPVLNDGPHLGYAIQWFAFALIALVFAGIMARQGGKGER